MDLPKNDDQGKSCNKSAFKKRRACLVKKAGELSVLCESEVALFVFGDDGKLFEYASNDDMPTILERFEKCKRIKQEMKNDPKGKKDVVTEEMEKLRESKDKHVLGRDLDSMSREDLKELEQQLNEGLLCIKDRKVAILRQQLEQSRDHDRRCTEENAALRRKVEELETDDVSTCTYQPPPYFFENRLMLPCSFAAGQGVHDPQMACSSSTGDANSEDFTLQLGSKTYKKVSAKRKTPDQGRKDDVDDTAFTL